MRLSLLALLVTVAFGQETGPAYEVLARAYEAARVGDYDTAVAGFVKSIEVTPKRASLRKDLAYIYLKIGENEAARAQFGAVVEMDSSDTQAALEYAFLSNEAGLPAEARRIFDRLRKTGNATAETAFRNIDGPLAEGIARWTEALDRSGSSFSAHFELARLAEQRDELELAATHYEKAWRLTPARRSVLVNLGRVWLQMKRMEDGRAALLAASFGGEQRTAETARGLLPSRYPYVDEFRRALDLDPRNAGLRRELAYLLLALGRQAEAEREFTILTETAPEDLLAATQLGFLLHAHGEEELAKPLFARVLNGPDEDLANRVRAVLHIPQLKARAEPQPAAVDAREMAERSIRAGYFADAIKYLTIAHEDDREDASIMVKLGWTHNLLRQDRAAYEWFGKARHARDPQTAAEANAAWKNLRPANETIRTTVWIYPMYSTRWRDLFSYGQAKAEIRTSLPVRPYISLRFIGDTTGAIGSVKPVYQSENAFILGVGLATRNWRGMTGWFEAGYAAGYLKRQMRPDYRGGISLARGLGRPLRGESSGWFAEATVDGVFVSRFGNDFLVYTQSRAGYTAGPPAWRTQLYWNGNITFDTQRQDWANFGETGPGLRYSPAWFPQGCYLSLDTLWGTYTGSFRRSFRDVRAGFWYARTR